MGLHPNAPLVLDNIDLLLVQLRAVVRGGNFIFNDIISTVVCCCIRGGNFIFNDTTGLWRTHKVIAFCTYIDSVGIRSGCSFGSVYIRYWNILFLSSSI